MAQHLAGEEQATRRLARDHRSKLTPVLVQLMPRRSLHQSQHILGVKSGELDALHTLLAAKGGEQRRERMIAREVGVTVGPHHHHPHRGARRYDMAEQR
jgi:hypothetical protein